MEVEVEPQQEVLQTSEEVVETRVVLDPSLLDAIERNTSAVERLQSDFGERLQTIETQGEVSNGETVQLDTIESYLLREQGLISWCLFMSLLLVFITSALLGTRLFSEYVRGHRR